MDLSNIPPVHGGALGDVWFKGLAKPDHFVSAMKEDFWILVTGCMMKYVRLERTDNGLSCTPRVVKEFNHGVDGVSAISGCQFKDVYALAEKRARPRIFIFQINKTDRGELEPSFVHSLKRIKSWDIRSMCFISKDHIVVLAGFPTFTVTLFKWITNEELMTSSPTEPHLFSKLLVNPSNPCQWMEYGTDYMQVYEMESLTRAEVIRTTINLPKRGVKFDKPDPLMGRPLATKIVSACWTIAGDFFILDEQLGIHQYVPEERILKWLCSLSQTFMGETVTQIVPYSDGLAAITKEGWFLYYGELKLGGLLEVQQAYKLSSEVIRYIFFPENPDSFFAITDSKGMVEGVHLGMLRDPFGIPDLMFTNIISCCFVEPQSDYIIIATKAGKVVVLESETGEAIAKWKLPFKVVGVASHPILPFLFCGTVYGCVNVLDVRNLKTPKLINRRFLTREPNPAITRFGFVSQGRYVISADTVNNRIFVQYGYPFMAFDFIDSVKVPARVSYITTPGCGKDDNRFQVFMSGKTSSDQGVVAFVINFNLRNDRLIHVGSQIVDLPITAMSMSPMKKYLYAFYPAKKQLGVVPFPEDNQYLNLQEPEYFVEHRLKFDVNFMLFQGTKLYTFGEDGAVQMHEAPVIPKKKIQLPMVLNSLVRVQTHCYSDGGIKEGVVSLDGSQVLCIGNDGTFARVRFLAKPKEPDWQTLGYDRPKLIDYQVGTYLIDQEFYKAGEEFMDRIADIKVKIDTDDPVNFYAPGEETSDEEEDAAPDANIPKVETVGEKLKYGPRKSFKGTVTRKKVHKKSLTSILATEESMTDLLSVSGSMKKRVTITTELDSVRGDDGSLKGSDESKKSGKSNLTVVSHKSDKSEGVSDATEAPKTGDTTDGEPSISVTAPTTASQADKTSEATEIPKDKPIKKGSIAAAEKTASLGVPDYNVARKDSTATADKLEIPTEKLAKSGSTATSSSEKPEAEQVSPPIEVRVPVPPAASEAGSTGKKEQKEKDQNSGSTESKSPEYEKDDTIADDLVMEPVSEAVSDKVKSTEQPTTTPEPTKSTPVTVLLAKTATPVASTAATATSGGSKISRRGSKESTFSRATTRSKKKLKTGETSVVQKLLSKVQESTVKPMPKPTSLAQMRLEKKKLKLAESMGMGQAAEEGDKTATSEAMKATTTSTALKGILSERIKRKQMAKGKFEKPEDKKEAVVKPVEEEKKPEEASEAEEEEEEAEEPVEIEETTDTEQSTAGSGFKLGVLKKTGLKGVQDMKKAAKVLGLLFSGKGKGKGKKDKDKAKSKSKIKIKKFEGGKAGKMLAEVSETGNKVKTPMSRTGRNRMDQSKSKLMKRIIDDDNLDPLAEVKAKKQKKKPKSPKTGKEKKYEPKTMPTMMAPKMRRKEGDVSEASRALMMEADTTRNIETSVLMDPAIRVQPSKAARQYEGLDVADVLTVHHAVRYKEYTESEFFAQFEKTLLHRWHVPKAQALRREFARFTELMDDLMFFNRQREEGNQVELKEFDFDEDREHRLRDKADKMKKIAQIQMMVRNKLRTARINAMKHLVWEQFETKGVTLKGFRKKLEVSNYPLQEESQFYDGPVKEAISWRRLEQRLELEEMDAIREANSHALRVLQHEMQFMPPYRKRQYMKSIMAIDPTIRFDEYEASDSDQSDEEFFAKVFEELGIQLPEDGVGDDMKSRKSAAESKSNKAANAIGIVQATSKAASKFLKSRKDVDKEQQPPQEGYVEKLKKMLLEEAEEAAAEQEALLHRPLPVSSSAAPTGVSTRGQSRRDFMTNMKPSRIYNPTKGLFGPVSSMAVGVDRRDRDEFEILMEPYGESKTGSEMDKTAEGGTKTEGKPTRRRLVTRQRKKMKFQRMPDVVFEDEEDLSDPEDGAVIIAAQRKFDMMDDEYKERFDTINNIFYGSSMSELIDMYEYKPHPFRYSQFDLGSRHELWRHHYIIMSEIYQMKKFFNRQFELLKNTKGYSLRKMSDRNERIREIYYYLKVNLDILDEKWAILEDPSQIFSVDKSEMPIERYLTAEQRRLEELRRLEDLARRKTRMAEFRKKALYVMMDNRLEVKREEILVNDIPKPPFMLEKDPLEFTLEEYLASLQYAEAVEALEKARVELIKELEEELGRLYRANAMEINTIDLRVLELAIMKFQFHQTFLMEETRIFRAVRQLRMMEDLGKEEERIGKIVGELKLSMKSSQNMAAQLENKKIACEEEIAKVAEVEKEHERNFRKDLGDVGLYFEFFYKNYKKKPKLSLKGLNKLEVYETMVRALRSDNIRNFAKENGETGRIVVMAIYDLEDPMLMPKDCPRSYWDRFNKVRRERLFCQYQTKTLVSEIDRISEAINECNRKEAEGTDAIAAVVGVISHKNDLKSYFVANVEFQMILGKGQCEIDYWSFAEHLNATIILIEHVEDLNKKIFAASEKLIREMTRTAGVHRDIKEIEWRFLVVEMATKDLKKVRHDILCFKPTKKLLQVLRQNINLDTMHVDRIALVDYLKNTYMKYQIIFLRTKRRLLRFYQRQTRSRHHTNEEYRGNIFEQTENLVASQVSKIAPDFNAHRRDEMFEKRTVQLMLRGYLNRKIVKLCNEVERLEEELERQYQRTYPVL